MDLVSELRAADETTPKPCRTLSMVKLGCSVIGKSHNRLLSRSAMVGDLQGPIITDTCSDAFESHFQVREALSKGLRYMTEHQSMSAFLVEPHQLRSDAAHGKACMSCNRSDKSRIPVILSSSETVMYSRGEGRGGKEKEKERDKAGPDFCCCTASEANDHQGSRKNAYWKKRIWGFQSIFSVV